MKFDELAKTRRTIHRYRSGPVDRRAVEEALAVAIWAANHRRTFPWRFILTGPVARAGLADLGVELKSGKRALSAPEAAVVREGFSNPAHLVILAMKRSADPLVAREDYASVAMGVQNASLSLWEKGIGSKWGTGAVTTHPKTYELVGCNPSLEEIVGFFWIGIPEAVPEAPARPPLAEFLRQCP